VAGQAEFVDGPLVAAGVSRRTFLIQAGRGVAACTLGGLFGSLLAACSSGGGLSGPFTVAYDASGSFQGTVGGLSLSGSGQSGGYGASYTLTGSVGTTPFNVTVIEDGDTYQASGTWGSHPVKGTVRFNLEASPVGHVGGLAGGSPVSGTIASVTVDNQSGGGSITGSLS